MQTDESGGGIERSLGGINRHAERVGTRSEFAARCASDAKLESKVGASYDLTLCIDDFNKSKRNLKCCLQFLERTERLANDGWVGGVNRLETAWGWH